MPKQSPPKTPRERSHHNMKVQLGQALARPLSDVAIASLKTLARSGGKHEREAAVAKLAAGGIKL